MAGLTSRSSSYRLDELLHGRRVALAQAFRARQEPVRIELGQQVARVTGNRLLQRRPPLCAAGLLSRASACSKLATSSE